MARLFLEKKSDAISHRNEERRLCRIHGEALNALEASMKNPTSFKPSVFHSELATPRQSSPRANGAFSPHSPYNRSSPGQSPQLTKNSLALVTRLLGKKHSLAQKVAKEHAYPFLPLSHAIEHRLSTLEATVRSRNAERDDKDQAKAMDLISPPIYKTRHGITRDNLDTAAKEHEDIPEIEAEIRLWTMLFDSIKAIS